MDASTLLARNIVSTSYEQLPTETVETTKKQVLDTLGVMVAATTLGEGVNEIVDLVAEMGGKQESTIIGFGRKAPALMAAYANGCLTHQLDYDDTVDAANIHPTAATLPAALAVAEYVGGVSGKEFITAVALGNDLIARLGLALTKGLFGYGWLRPAALGYFSSAAAAGRLLGLDQDQMVNTLGLVYDQTAGSLESVVTPGSTFRAIRDGFCAKAGVLSAFLAKRGIRGEKRWLEGKYGLYNLYFNGDYDPDRLTAGLGDKFEGADVSFKPWPCCRSSHVAITAVLDIVREHDIAPDDVAEVRLNLGEHSQSLCEPIEERRRPQAAIDAKFSLPFSVGCAIARRGIKLRDYTSEGLRDPMALDLASKVTCQLRPEFTIPGTEPAEVEVRTRSGSSFAKRADIGHGHPRDPMTPGELESKFRDCASFSIKPLSRRKIDEAIRVTGHLDELADVRVLIQLFGA